MYVSAVVYPSFRIPAHFLVIRPTSAPVLSWMAKSHDIQFSPSIEPIRSALPLTSAKCFLPTTFSWRIAPRSVPSASETLILDFMSLRGALHHQNLLPIAVEDAELVREELVDPAEQPHGLLGLRLFHLADRADLGARTVEDAVLVRHLDDLRLLRDHEQVMTEQIRHWNSFAGLGLPLRRMPRMSLASRAWPTDRLRELVERAAHTLDEHLHVRAAVPVGDCGEVELPGVRQHGDDERQVARTGGNHPLNACRSSMPALVGEAAPD